MAPTRGSSFTLISWNVDGASTQSISDLIDVFLLTKNGIYFSCKRLLLISKLAGTQRRAISFLLVSPGGDDVQLLFIGFL